MFGLSQAQTKRLTAIHGWSGMILGLLLYAVIFTGAVAVFEDEIEIWSRGAAHHHDGLGTRVDHYFRVNARDVDRTFYEDVLITRTADGNFRYLFHADEPDPETGRIVARGVQLIVSPDDKQVLDRWEGKLSDLEPDPGSALRRFLVDIHVQLYVPRPWGLLLTGILGLAMMAAAVSGIMIHKHLIRDAFLAARSSARLVGVRDLHVLAGTWGLPFAFLLAFTGAFFSFAISIGIPAMTLVAFGGDMQLAEETVLGIETTPDLTQAPVASLDYIIHDALDRRSGTVRNIQITNYDSVSSKVILRMSPDERGLAPVLLEYDGESRKFEGIKPSLGLTPSVADSVIGLIGPLHFGDFGGLASKTVWFGLGLAMSWVTASGLLLWVKRREDSALWRGFGRWVDIFVWGLPVAMLGSAVTYFLSMPAGDPHWWTPFGFLLASIYVVGVGLFDKNPTAQLRIATAAILVALPVLRHLTNGTSWSEAILAGAIGIIVLDILLIIGGVVILRRSGYLKSWRPSSERAPAE